MTYTDSTPPENNLAERPPYVKPEVTELHRHRKNPNVDVVLANYFVLDLQGCVEVERAADGNIGLIRLTMDYPDSPIGGLMTAVADMTNLALQHGASLKDIVKHFKDTRFAPSGETGNPKIPQAKSVLDYMFRWLGQQFLTREEQEELDILPAVYCDDCGDTMIRNGTTYKCLNCTRH